LLGPSAYAVEAGNTSYVFSTWTWDGVRWSKVDTEGPTGLFSAAMATLGHEIILVGSGPDYLPPPGAESETWRFDGSTWKRLDIKSPPWRLAPAMASW